ncbi:MAG: hypothetical protein JJT95_09360 [Pararhodobacter sp.]|nr:hypothetical protein [Pararhodobacter sp.]
MPTPAIASSEHDAAADSFIAWLEPGREAMRKDDGARIALLIAGALLLATERLCQGAAARCRKSATRCRTCLPNSGERAWRRDPC